jgi:L-threonylcarbamoyladenylate synthase
MEILRLTTENVEACASRAAEVLREGGVILYPTDTLYGLGADAFSDAAFQKICMIKDRDERRPIHAVFADLAMAAQYAELTPLGETLARAFLPGPLTLVFRKKPHYTTGIGHTIPTVGVRIPRHPFCLALAKKFGKPFTTTSANKSGSEPPSNLSAIIAQLGENAAHINLAIDGGEVSPYMRSTVVDVRESEPHVMREGAILSQDIEDALQATR